MPELPEVETILSQITPQISGRTITNVSITKKGERLVLPLYPEDVSKNLINNSIQGTERLGKYMMINLSNTGVIVAHLRMSGRFVISEGKYEHVHNRLALEFDDNSHLNFINIRRFATFRYYQPNQTISEIEKLGPDALTASQHLEQIFLNLSKRNKSIYASLLDQSIIAGIGNIYANEILFLSNLHPERPSNALSKKKIQELLMNTEYILNEAINHKGTTLIDKSFTDINGGYGVFFYKLKVYGKVGEKCQVCKTEIKKLKISGRSVYYCSKCQKL